MTEEFKIKVGDRQYSFTHSKTQAIISLDGKVVGDGRFVKEQGFEFVNVNFPDADKEALAEEIEYTVVKDAQKDTAIVRRWREFASLALNEGAGDTQRAEVKGAFFAGARDTLALAVCTIASHTPGDDTIERIEEEINAFIMGHIEYLEKLQKSMQGYRLMQFRFKENAAERIKDLRKRMGVQTNAEVIRQSLALMDRAIGLTKSDGRVIFCDVNGDEEAIKIPVAPSDPS